MNVCTLLINVCVFGRILSKYYSIVKLLQGDMNLPFTFSYLRLPCLPKFNNNNKIFLVQFTHDPPSNYLKDSQERVWMWVSVCERKRGREGGREAR